MDVNISKPTMSKPAESRRRSALALAAILPLAAILALLFAACGAGEDDSAADEGSRTVSPEHLADFKRGTPQRVVLEWWRYVQFRNPEEAYALYADDVDVEFDDVDRQIKFAASSFVGVPEIVDVDRSDGLATVYMTVRPPGSDAAPRPLSVNLRHEEGGWRLRDNAVMDHQAARVARARATADDD